MRMCVSMDQPTTRQLQASTAADVHSSIMLNIRCLSAISVSAFFRSLLYAITPKRGLPANSKQLHRITNVPQGTRRRCSTALKATLA
jgi:hypothetical protein